MRAAGRGSGWRPWGAVKQRALPVVRGSKEVGVGWEGQGTHGT